MAFKLDDDVFPLHLENQKEALYAPLRTSQRIKYTCFAVSKNYIIFGATSGGLYVFKRHPYSFFQLIPSKETTITAICISSSESLVACATNKNIVRIIEVSENCNGKLITRTEDLSEFEITALCWTEDNSKPTLFIGDSGGRVSFLKLSFLSKNILNIPTTLFMSLDTKIVQLCCENDIMVVSTLTRCYICDLTREHYKQIGQQLRDGLYGVTFLRSRKRIFCARPGSRLWEVDFQGDVHSTHQFKRQLAVPPSTFVSLFDNPKIHAGDDKPPVTSTSLNFVKLYDLLGRYVVAYHGDTICVLNTDTVDVLFWCNCFGHVVDVQCTLNSVFVWNTDGDLHELIFLPIEKYVLTLYLKGHYDLCVHILSIFYEKLVSSFALHELYPLKDLEWPSEESDDEEVNQKMRILIKFKQKLKSFESNQIKLGCGIHVVNNRFLSYRLLDDSVIGIQRSDFPMTPNGLSGVENGEYRKRSNSLPSSLKKKKTEEEPLQTNNSNTLRREQRNFLNDTGADDDLNNYPFVTFASYHILRENFNELGANFSQIFNDSSRNLKQKLQMLESKITSRVEDTNSNVPVPVISTPFYEYEEEIVEIDDEPIVEQRKTKSTNGMVNGTDEIASLFDVLRLDSSSDVEIFDALNTVVHLCVEKSSLIPVITATAPVIIKEMFTNRCFEKSFLISWFDSENFALAPPSSLVDQYPSMLARLFDEKELKHDYLLSRVLAVFGALLEARTLLDKIKSFQLPCYYKSFCYVLKHFQRDDPSYYERVEGDRIDWPTPVYLNTMLLMISVDRKDVFCEMGIKKNVDAVDVLYLLLHASQIESKDEVACSTYDYKNVWLNYVQRRQCEYKADCLNDTNVLRLAVNTLVSCNSGLQDLCCSNCWFLLPQTSIDRVEFEPLSCAIFARFWSILTQSLDSDGIDYAMLLSFRRAISEMFTLEPCTNVCYKNIDGCEHLICKIFREFLSQLPATPANASPMLAFNAICNLCYRVPYLWKYLPTLQKGNSCVKLLGLFHYIQLDDMQLLQALYSSSMNEDEARKILDCMASMSEGRCLNCSAKVFDNSDLISWDNVSTFVLQRLGAARTLKLLRHYSAAKVNLSNSFYRSALLTSLPKIGPELSDRVLSIVSNHCQSNHISSNNLTELHNAYERDNVARKSSCITAPSSNAHHWGISVQAEQTNQAICYCCSLPLFSKSLIKEYNGGITVFSCSHTYHTICLKNKNCTLTCIVCDRFLR